MAAKGVYVELRNLVTHATLPDNRSMVAGKSYLISVDDFQRLSRSVRESVIQVTGIETKAYVVNFATDDGNSLTTDDQYLDLSTDVGEDDAALAESGWKAGQVLQGLNGEAFKLCKADGSVSEGDVVTYSDETAALVETGSGTFAGVSISDLSDGEWGWVQTEGIAEANAESSVSAGDNLKAKSNGNFDTAAGNGDTVATALGDESGGKVEVALRSTRARNRYVKRPNLFYPGQ